MFFYPELLSDILPSSTNLRIHCNAGVATVTMLGKLAGYGNIWFHPDGIAKILSLSHLKPKFILTYDSHGSHQFIVQNSNGAEKAFKQSAQRLFYIDMHLQKVMLFNIVGILQLGDNQYKYSSHDYSKATLACKIQRTIVRPSTKQFISIVSENLLLNCPIDTNDILAAENIFGPDIGALKGKTTQKKPKYLSLKRSIISPDLLLQYKDVIVEVDIMFVNKVPYLMSTS